MSQLSKKAKGDSDGNPNSISDRMTKNTWEKLDSDAQFSSLANDERTVCVYDQAALQVRSQIRTFRIFIQFH